MSIDRIIKRLEKSGHKVGKSIPTGNVIVKSSWGSVHVFNSYRAAYNFYYKGGLK